jgi:hypothetical protein
MSKQTASQGLLAAFVGLVVIQAARSASAAGGWTWPKPSIFVAPAIIYSALSLVAAASAEVAVALAVGIDLATAVAPNAANSVEGVVTKALRSSFVGTQTAVAGSGADAKSGYRSSPAPAPIVQGTTSDYGNISAGAVPISNSHYQ